MRFASILTLALAVAACKKSEPPAAQPGAPVVLPAQGGAAPIKGKLLERVDAAPYSYLRIDTGAGEIWAAVPQNNLAAGAEVTVENPMAMDGWESKTLNRKFEKIVFGTLPGQVSPAMPAAPPSAGAAPAGKPSMPPSMPPAAAGIAAQHAAAAAGPSDVGEVKVAKAAGADARTVAEIHAQKAKLKEKNVVVRGKVVKFSAGIMGRNWVHLRDGTGSQAKGDNDITVTTSDTAGLGDIVVAKGVVRLDKDFGAGYAYPVIVEEASLSK